MVDPTASSQKLHKLFFFHPLVQNCSSNHRCCCCNNSYIFLPHSFHCWKEWLLLLLQQPWNRHGTAMPSSLTQCLCCNKIFFCCCCFFFFCCCSSSSSCCHGSILHQIIQTHHPRSLQHDSAWLGILPSTLGSTPTHYPVYSSAAQKSLGPTPPAHLTHTDSAAEWYW